MTGFDFYAALTRAWERRVIGRSIPRSGVLSSDGVGLFFEVGQPHSISKVGCDFARKLAAAGIECSACDTTPPPRRGQFSAPQAIEGLCSALSPFKKAIVLGGPDQLLDTPYDIYREVFFEFGKGIEKWRPQLFHGTDGILVFSDFCRKAVSSVASSHTRIFKIRYPFILPSLPGILGKNAARRRFGIPERAFSIFFNFSYGSSLERKNPEGLVSAFAKAFQGVPAARLVFKTMAAESHPELAVILHRSVEEHGIADKTVFIDTLLSEQEVLELTASMDVYASLHRGEGLGLGMLEAMSLGVPVVATGYGGNTDFCSEETAFLVPFELEDWRDDCGFPQHMGEWAEADVDAAATILKAIFDNPQLGRQRSQRGQEFVRKFFSVENFRSDVLAFLEK